MTKRPSDDDLIRWETDGGAPIKERQTEGPPNRQPAVRREFNRVHPIAIVRCEAKLA